MSDYRWHPDEFELRREANGIHVKRKDGIEVCDFCLLPGPTWEYPAAEMEIVGNPLLDRTDDAWGACDECRRLVDAHDVGALVERMVQIQRAAELPAGVLNPPQATARRAARTNVLNFMEARTGPAVPYRHD